MPKTFFERVRFNAALYFRRLTQWFGNKPNNDNPIHVARFNNFNLQKIRGGKLPNWRQLKYAGKFFSTLESRVVAAAASIAVLSSLLLAGTFFWHHTNTVPKTGGEYSEAMIGQPKFINPLFASANDIDSDLTSLVYNSLFAYDSAGNLTPDLADNYTLSPDKKTYTIRLKSGIVWSDKEPVTADDVQFTWDLIQNAAVGSPLYSTFQSVVVEKVDARTIRFTLKQPFAPFLDSLTVGILPAHIWQNIQPENIKLAKNNLQPVGTGAWQFAKLTKDNTGVVQTYSLRPNPLYFGPQPYLQTLTFKFFPDYNSAIDAVRGQTVDALSFVPREAQNKLQTKNIVNYDLRLPQYTALFFNVASPNLKNTDVRQTLAAVIDKNAALSAGLNGDGLIIDGPILPGRLGYDENLKRPSESIEAGNAALDKIWTRVQPGDYFKKEQARLEQALPVPPNSSSTIGSPAASSNSAIITETIRRGMDPAQQFYRSNKNGDIIVFNMVTADNPEYRQVAEYAAQTWRNLGIKTTITYVSPRQFTHEVLRTHQYDIILYGEIVGNDPDLYPFWHSSQISYPGLNLSQWNNAAGDKLLEIARATDDNTKRADLYRQFQEILNTEMPAVFLYSPTHIFAVNKRIKGIVLTAVATPESRYRGLYEWYTNTKFKWK